LVRIRIYGIYFIFYLKLCRGKNQRGKATCDNSSWANEMDNQPSGPAEDLGDLNDLSASCKAGESESEAVLSLQNRIKSREQHAVKKVKSLYIACLAVRMFSPYVWCNQTVLS
jgi:hypothetical protein